MKYEDLEKYLYILSEQHKKLEELHKLGVDLIDFSDPYMTLTRILWMEILTSEGLDWLEWFIWERGGIEGKPINEIGAWDENGNPICKDLKGVYEYLVANNYFKINS
jgi:hypothetical protein